YEIIVSSQAGAESGEAWSSGKVESAASTQVAYAGAALVSGRSYFWKVRYWDKSGRSSPFSRVARFGMGLMARDDWKGRWIGGKNQLRKEFDLDKSVVRARAYVCGLGYSEFRLNGRKVGRHVLDPAWTTYDKRALYATYDVTRFLRPGRNALAVMLGQGWFKATALLVQMNIELDGGEKVEVVSDATWRAASGPVLKDSLYNGETYDARLETPGWDRPGYDDRAWDAAELVAGPGGVLSAQMMPPIQVVDTIVPLTVSNPRPGVYVYDMGQNFSGWAVLRVRGPRGTAVKLRFSELVYDTGMINPENLRGARAEDVYILKGEGEEVWEPRFTYHGFRYVELTGYPGVPAADAIRGRVVHTAVEPAGGFACSKPILNELQRIIVWGQKTNLHSIPTDCCQRDERMGWMGDAQGTAEEAIYNFDMAAFYTNFLRDIRDVQDEKGTITDTVPHVWGSRPADPAWGTAYPLIAWYVYQYYGDKRVLEEHYDGIKKYVEFLRSRAEDGLVKFSHYGDWVAVEKPPGNIVSSFYYYYDVKILAEIADILGKEAEARSYANLAAAIKSAFHEEYFDPKTGNYAGGTQTANALPLFLDIVPKESRGVVWGNLFNDIVYQHDSHLTTGIIGTKYIMELLTNSGSSDLAYDIATKTGYPSWGYMIENGATTLWELWQLRQGPSMNSHNHPMFGSVGAWLYKALAGINLAPGSVGFEKIRIAPQMVRDLRFAAGSTRTVRGEILSSWSRDERSVRIEVVIPVGSEAEVVIPKFNLENVVIREGVRVIYDDQGFHAGTPGVQEVEAAPSGFLVKVGSGRYDFLLSGD
ncbi:MAG: family 78 glycoside hydrolase catalytic domain, partial [Candidatus Aminicenantes bacterium]|nr:family 78 glycoside hydrolase catalytic domain [Candidatus Aminicenantes bacterium]